MSSQLAGRAILVVEDEPIIALDITYLLECVGAHVVTSGSLQGALALVEADRWSAAVLDHLLNDGDTTPICERLKERDVPFLLYTSFDLSKGPCRDGTYLSKPAPAALLVRTVEGLLHCPPISDRTCAGQAKSSGFIPTGLW